MQPDYSNNEIKIRTNKLPLAMTIIQIGQWRIPENDNKIISKSGEQALRNKVMRVLLYLAENHQRVVSRQELIAAIWDGNAAVGERALTNAIYVLRNALGKSDEFPESIETISKSGYRLLLPIKSKSPLRQRLVSSISAVVVVIALSIYAFVLRDPTTIKPQGTQLVPQWNTKKPIVLVKGNTSGIQQKISPQGDRLVYAREVDGQHDLYLKRLKQLPKSFDTQKLANELSPSSSEEIGIRLTNNQLTEGSISWSPLGHQFVFVRGDDKNSCGIFIYDINEKTEKLITQCFSRPITKVNWSNDSNLISFYNKRVDQNSGGLFIYDLTNQQNRRLPIPGSNRYSLDGYHSWSPDNSRLAFTRSTNIGGSDLYIFDMLAEKIERLTYNNKPILGLSWSPDGQSLTYASEQNQRFYLHYINLADKQITALHQMGYNPTLTNNNLLVFQHLQGHTYLNWLPLPSETISTNPKKTVLRGHFPIPDFQHQKNQISYIADSNNGKVIHISDSDGNTIHQVKLPNSFKDISAPTLSPVSNQIAFIAKSQDNDFFQVYVQDLVSQEIKQISQDSGDHVAPQWSNNGEWIYSSTPITGRWELWRYPLRQKVATQFTRNGGGFYRELNGQHFYSKPDTYGIWQKDQTNNEKLIVSELNQKDWGNWDLTKSGIYYVGRESKKDTINFHEFTTGQTHKLAEFPRNTIAIGKNFGFNPLRNQIMYISHEITESQILALTQPL